MVMRTLGNLLRFCALAGWMAGVCSGQEKPAPKVPDASSALAVVGGGDCNKQHCVACHGERLEREMGRSLLPTGCAPDLKHVVAPPWREVSR